MRLLIGCVLVIQTAASTPEQRAVDYLSIEVPRWFAENQCMSCHNNGDGARALYAALQLGYTVPAGALSGTTRWLLEPAKWDSNRGSPAFSDKKLAALQFAASLTEAYGAGAAKGRTALFQAAEALAASQEIDGSWQVDAEVEAGSPATYGSALATYMALGVLERAGVTQPARKARDWLLTTKPRSTLDRAAMLLASPAGTSRYLEPILRAQTSDGGWGPQPGAPAEPFDTAVVLLALKGVQNTKRTQESIARGRTFLIRLQQPSGGWPETTRPPGAQSYAQHISTSAWATLALIRTASMKSPRREPEY